MKKLSALTQYAASLLLMAVSVFATTSTSTQTSSPERGILGARSYSVSDIESVGNYAGNLMLNIPLAQLPSGRGGITGGVRLRYDSKIWDLFNDDVERGGVSWPAGFLVPGEQGGWSYAYKYELRVDGRKLGYGVGACTVGVYESNFPYKIQLISPDGATHSLIDTAADADGFVGVTPDGLPACGGTAPTPGSTVTFFSTDGTFLRLEVIADSDSDWTNNKWTLIAPDGTTVKYDPAAGYTQRISDKNGNSIDITEVSADANYSNHRTTYIQDSLGRNIVIEYGAATDEDRIHSLGVGGEDITTAVKWKEIRVNRNYFACASAPAPYAANAFQNYALDRTFQVVDEIDLPSQLDGNLKYSFGYNADDTATADEGWGELNYLSMPSGAYVEYSYFYSAYTDPEAITVTGNRPVEKQLHYSEEYDGSSTPVTETWTYAYTMRGDNDAGSLTITGPDGGTTTEYYADDTCTGSYGTPCTRVTGETLSTTTPDGSISSSIYETNEPIANTIKANRYVKYEFNTIADSSGTPSKTAIKEYSRDKNGNVTEVKEYDFVAYSSIPKDGGGFPTGLPSGISSYLKRITKTEYYNDTPDASSTTYSDADSYHLASSPRLLGLVKAAEVQDASSTPKSRVEMTYDYTDYASSNTVAGNPTQTKSWDSFKGGSARSYSAPLTSTNSITTSATYNSYGMPLTATDANGNVTQITYGNVAGPGGNVTDLYPTQTVAAYGTAVARTSVAVYDFYTGLPVSTTDADNGVSTVTTYDDLGRATKVAAASGTALESWTQTEYHDADRFVVVKSDLETKGDGRRVATQFFDQLGRVRLSKTLEDAAAQSATNETDGIKVQTRYKSVSGYTYQLTSNPYRASTSSGASGEDTMGWTRSKAWATGHESQVETFAGATLPQPFLTSGYNTSSTGVVDTVTDVNAATVTDQAGKLRRSITNALGQLVRVDEPNSSSQLGSVSSPNQDTSYAYDVLNNLTTVTQGSQTRTFAYSSLSRLTSATNPESGTIGYVYDSNGNLTSKTDARSITTTYTYDYLNRITDRDYSDSTPDVDYTYGTTAPKIGKLTKVDSTVSTTEYTLFDILGRVTGAKQTTDGTDYTTSYTYKLNGALDEETYPSGRVVKNVLDNNGDLSMVQSKKDGNHGFFNYAKNFTYNAAGAVTSMQLGNGRWESTTFNSRLQPTQIALGVTPTATDLLKLDYSYGTTANNGNVQSQTITVPGMTYPLVQSYAYDELNRLSSATETSNGTQTWKQAFTFDRYGNRNFDEANTTTLPKNCGSSPNFTVCAADKKVVDPEILTSNNRIKGDQDGDTVNDYTFDSSGNTTLDAGGQSYVYDAENKMVSASNGSGTLGEYSYDGDGKRVKKVVPHTGETTIFVYDTSGKLVAEYSTVIASTNDAKVSYLTNDNLGSPRINTDQNGAVTARHDYHPFGEEIDGVGGRTTGLSYSSDSVRKQFTGYERDNEIELDFAQARMYAKDFGRFTSPDPLLSSATLANPASWNRYAYSCNNPVVFVDPTGLYVWGTSLGGNTSNEELAKTAAGAEIVKIRNKIMAIIEGMDTLISDALKKGTISKDQAAALSRAAKAYGAFGQAGITVGIGKVKDGVAETKWGMGENGKTAAWTSDENGVATPNIVVTFEGPITIEKVMHEGSHVADRNDYVAGYNERIKELTAGTSTEADPTKLPANIEIKESEVRAYSVSSAIAQMTNDANSEVWKRGISESERATLIANKVGSLKLKGKIYVESKQNSK
ncbi:MAG: RHS repeat-associated core domain-containing protein [Acidobacteria bacterium]|nr:RHS repeat-associated core domain-containing protein [Acidobacteriota bacterium]